MNIQKQGKYLHIYGDDLDPTMLLGWKRRRGQNFVIAEDNTVNRIVLGLNPVQKYKSTQVQNTDRLRGYQVADICKMLELPHFLNANPMGLGKTPETVRYLQEIKATTALIVTPKIVRYQWKHQLKEWGGFQSKVYENQKMVKPGIWIINYDRLRNEAVRDKFRNFVWDALILDEAHKIKSRNSIQTKAVKSLPAVHRVALTGTPILRYVDDLWSILDFLDWTYAGISYWNFVNYFCKIQVTPWGNKIVGLTDDPRKVAVLNKLMQMISIRNEAVEVARGKYTEVVRLPMSKKQRELYRKEKQLLLDELPETLTIANGAVLAMRLMQTTSWPGLFIEGEPGPKFEWIREICENNPDEKIVVFSVFEQSIRALTAWLNDNKIKTCSITGKNKSEVNEAARTTFIDGDAQVLAGTIGAMGQGYDGLQHASRIVVFIDRDWSPEIMAQAEDRLRRMGQEYPVSVYYLECQGSFDQYVGRINRNKAADIRKALTTEEDA